MAGGFDTFPHSLTAFYVGLWGKMSNKKGPQAISQLSAAREQFCLHTYLLCRLQQMVGM